ncbi:MAG: MarR family transcriptional regulator [Dehalococcoidia bacterium]|nr:MarR family transcriptional regulator [Dehalococcoidia bacterium]
MVQTNELVESYEKLWFLFRLTHDAIGKAMDLQLQSIGVSRIQIQVLYVIRGVTTPVTPAVIARWLYREPHTVKVILDNMEKDELIRRVKDLPKKNLIRVTLTQKGEEAIERSKDLTVLREIMDSLKAEEREGFASLLTTLEKKALEKMQELHGESLIPTPLTQWF